MRSRERRRRRSLLVALTCVAILTSVAIWVAFAVLRPTPPRSVAMAIDPEGSFNAELGERYREFLARDGIDLRLVPTAGAIESAALLRDAKSGISIAIIPGGITNQQESPGLVSLGTLFYEPLWLFFRGRYLEKPDQLRGRRISIGPEGSASNALSIKFLARVGIIDQKTATLLPLKPQESAAKLLNGEIDAAVLMDAWETATVQQLLTAGDVNLAGVRRADAFVALYPYLNKLVLPAGVADMVENRPPTNVTLLADKPSLVVRRDLHPAIQYLLLAAASEIHSRPGVFNVAAQFPAPESIDFPISTHARQFYKNGTQFLQRYLPFWLAVLVQQLLVLLIPLVGFLYPLLRFSPEIYSWVERHRVYRLYSDLKVLEEELNDGIPDEQLEDFRQRLDQLQDRASRFSVPVAFRSLLYVLRWHINFVRRRAQKSGYPEPPP